MDDREVDFKSLVERIQTGEIDYAARINEKGIEFKETQSLFVKSIDEDKRQIEAVVSTADLDRYDEVMLPESFRELLPEYLKNPIVISSHQHRLETGHSSVVGQVIKAWIDAQGLHVIIWFAETELGNEFWYLYKNKFQRAFSVGFIPIPGGWKDEVIDGRQVRTYTKVELLEISCVPVPANRNALSKSRQRRQSFIGDKISRRQLEKDAEEYAILTYGEKEYEKIMAGDDLDALELDAEFDEIELSGEGNLEPEPDYVNIVKSG